MTYGVIGVGEIAAAIVTGLSRGEAPPAILLSPRGAATAASLAARFTNVRVCADNQAVADGADTLVLAIRPQDAASVLAELRVPADRAIVSVMAGVPIETLARLMAPATRISRAIPLPAVARGEGMTPVMPPGGAASALFAKLGGTVEVDDVTSFDALSAASGTMAAHFAVLGWIAGWVATQGVEAGDAARYVAAIYAGLTPELASGTSFDDLARAHATRGGINELFLAHLSGEGLAAAVDGGLDEVMRRLSAA